MGSSGGSSPNVVGAARVEAEANRQAAQEELWGNRPNQTNPFGSTTWTPTMVDANTGQPIRQLPNGDWVPVTEGGIDLNPGGQYSSGGSEYTSAPPRPSVMPMDEVGFGRARSQRLAQRSRQLQAQREWDGIYGGGGGGGGGGPGGGAYYGPEIDPVTSWEQTNTLNPEWQPVLDSSRGQLQGEIDYRTNQTAEWAANPVDYGMYGGDNLQNTVGRGDLAQFGTTSPTTGAQDWRQFGVTNPTTGANDWRQFGTTEAQITGDDWRQFGVTNPTTGANDWRQFGTSEAQITGDDWRQFGTTDQTIQAGGWRDIGNADPTIGADDWRQFGTTGTNIQSGDYDARYGSSRDDYRSEFGDHDMSGSDWDTLQYAPEAIRRQAEQQTLDFMNSQLDPQWDTRQQDLEIQLANQGLQWGDAAYDNAMESMKRSRDTAYSGARNQALADSRAEAAMLWDQEMGRSEQINRQLQMDTDNAYRARQSNIANYLGGREQDIQGHLAYQQAAFGQDLASRQQQLDSDLGYGRESFGQDLASRQQALDAELSYGREAWQQDFNERNRQAQTNLAYGSEGFQQDYAGRQQQLDANRLYGQQAYMQDYQSRQQQLDANLAYGSEGFRQDYAGRQQQLDANRLYGQQAYTQDYQSRQQQLDANRLYNQQAFDQDRASRQDNITNYLNYGNAEYNQQLEAQRLGLTAAQYQEMQQQQRYGLVDPNQTSNTITSAFGG